MAIGNNGGSAATRFRPRGTAPVGGLGRRSLLAAEGDQEQNEDNVEEEGVSNVQQTEPEQTTPAPRRAALGTRRASLSGQATASKMQSEAVTGSLESQEVEESMDVSETVSEDSSTSTDPSPSSTTQTTTRGRGRPRGRSTRTAATLSFAPDSTVAISVSDARARMREIEQQVKQLRGDHAAELEAVNNRYRDHVSPLQAEYQELSQTITMITFGF